jgi:hypothetical protein
MSYIRVLRLPQNSDGNEHKIKKRVQQHIEATNNTAPIPVIAPAMVPKFSPLAPLSTIHSVPLSKDDLITEENEDTIGDDSIETFDAAWGKLVHERGCFNGTHEGNIEALQQEALRLKNSKDDIKAEFTRQTVFVRNNRNEMEASFKVKMEKIMTNQGISESKAHAKRDTIDTMSKSASITLPWQHFIRELDRLTALSTKTSYHQIEPTSNDSNLCNDRIAYLTSLYQNTGRNEDSVVVLQRANEVENVLLREHILMLTKEIDRYESIALLQEEVGTELRKLHVAQTS